MLYFRDWVLLVASLSSIVAGIMWPEYGVPFRPLPIYCMTALLFFCFLSIRLGVVLSSVRGFLPALGRYIFIKLILLPVLVYFFFRWLLPEYAVAALILTGISSGVASPFFAGLVEANISLVFGMVVASSVLVPFTLPFLAHILVGKYMEISLAAMSRLLGLVIFCPLIVSEILKRFTPDFAARLSKAQYGVSLVSFVVTNIGIFSQLADFLRKEPATVLISLGVATLLAGTYFLAGMLFSLGRPLPDHLSLIIIFGFVNNVLAMVLSARFFGPLGTTVAAMYTIPFFCLIVPLRLYRNWAGKRYGA
jgi:BASS family bile acid:Na+ symporter